MIYDYDTTAQADTSWGEIASPAGSGAMLTSGETFMGTYENEEQMDEYDMEVEQEDEEALALFREENGLDQHCYLASQAYTYAIQAGGNPTGGGYTSPQVSCVWLPLYFASSTIV